MDVGGRDDVDVNIDDDDNDDQDNMPLSVRLKAMQAQPSMPAGDVVAENIARAREVELLQPRM